MNDPDQNEGAQAEPSEEELQAAAREVWQRLKIFGAFVGVFAVCVIVFFGVTAYLSFGVVGLIIAALIVMIVLWLLTSLLEMF